MSENKDDKKSKSNSKPAPKELDKIKSSFLSRGLSLAKITISAGSGLAGKSISTAFSSKEKKDEKWKEFLQNQASFLSQELGELKGSLMKAGQMLSMYGEHFLPPEANEFLKSLQSDSPALKWSAIEPILLKHLGPELMSELEFEKEALACASIGQVHRARIKATNELVAVKVQYPDVDKAIDSDLKAIKGFLSLAKLVPKDVKTDHIFAEVKNMLVQEMDYEQEAKWTELFAEKLANDQRYVVPKIYRRYSNKKVITTSFERGLRADEGMILSLAPERRNKIALAFLDLYFMELFELKVVQTDPHVGNYKIRVDPSGNDQIVLLDFGATRAYESEFMKAYHLMIKASLYNDLELFEKAAKNLRFIQDGDSPELKKTFEAFCFEVVEPFLDRDDARNNSGQIDELGRYDWKNTDLPQRLTKKIFKIIQSHKWRTPPQEILFLDRKTGGVFIFLAVLGVKLKGRDILLKYLSQVKEE